ncbi:glycosyltransferase family 4 protein [Afifella pfennigii]|uniref:glycosyltransferase family 4 protein n=1 Tax=Afifella pfennigii TaxID=209897 RepID=UPI000479475D|nr:glycosyltransferase family 4 protein [Afifella pfennigii]
MKTSNVCFVALYAYPLFDTASRAPFGGSEVRAALLARLVAAKDDLTVHFFVGHHGAADRQLIDDVLVHQHPGYPMIGAPALIAGASARTLVRRLAYAVWARLPFRRVLRPVVRPLLALPHRLRPAVGGTEAPQAEADGATAEFAEPCCASETAALLERCAADVVVTFGVNDVSAETIACCRRRGCASVLCIGSDSDLADHFRFASEEVDAWGRTSWRGQYALAHASAIVVQTEWQRQRLAEAFGRDGLIIANPVVTDPVAPGEGRDIDVLWVGKSDGCKRPELCLELARALPNRRFHMVMTRSDPTLHETVLKERPANVTIDDYVPFSEIDGLFARARILVSTSTLEGFPNTFLQAGKAGVPIASLVVDPDGFLTATGSGFVAAGDMNALCAGIERLVSDEAAWLRASDAVRSYIDRTHNAGRAAEGLVRLIRACADEPEGDKQSSSVATLASR